MNNSNGTALLARVRSGMLVTIRDARGTLVTRRAIVTHTGRYLTRDARGQECELRAADLVSVLP